jgi:cytochrome c
MFDTMTLTKIGGGLFGSLLVFLLGTWVADSIYATPEVHGEGEHAQAYVIEVASAEGEESGEPAEDPVALFTAAFAVADAAAGEGEFRPCAACHALVEGENKTGPYLYGVVGRPVDTAAGFEGYSGELEKYADVWTPENLNLFLLKPSEFAPGTAMNFQGLEDAQDRANLIAYLDSIDG